jgi:hypothetical protein
VRCSWCFLPAGRRPISNRPDPLIALIARCPGRLTSRPLSFV